MRRTKHRRRFHTDRVVANRRRRFIRESRWMHREPKASNHEEWLSKRLSYGYLDGRDPWDCGNPGCWCHKDDRNRGREHEEREWRRYWL
jgi:hypothetical protein